MSKRELSLIQKHSLTLLYSDFSRLIIRAKRKGQSYCPERLVRSCSVFAFGSPIAKVVEQSAH